MTAQFSNGLSQDVYKIPIATFTNPDGLGQVSGNAYIATKASGAANVNLANTGAAGGIASQVAGRFDRRSGDRVHQPDHHPARLFSASARIVTTADQMLQQLEQLPSTKDDAGKARKTGLSRISSDELSEAFMGSFTTALGPF